MTLTLALCGMAAAQDRWEGGYGVPAVDPLDDVGIERLDALFAPRPAADATQDYVWYCILIDVHDRLLEDCVVHALDFVSFDVPLEQQHTTFVVHYPMRFHPSTEP